MILSLEKIFDTSGEQIKSFLQHTDLNNICQQSAETKYYDEILFDEFIKEFKLDNSKVIHANWFHNTRTLIDSSFSKGILPSQMAIHEIEILINNIVEKLNIPLNNVDLSLCPTIQGKLNCSINQGPWGFLIRDFAFEKPEGIHDYLKAPELIEDILQFRYGDKYDLLIHEFQKATARCIVKFKSDEEFHHQRLSKVISYLYHKVKNEDMDWRCNANFSNNGNIIKPEMIIKIDYL